MKKWGLNLGPTIHECNRRDQKQYAPRPLPQQRPRALTPPLPAEPPNSILSSLRPFRPKKQRFHPQTQSSLLTRLPPEIRVIIWRHVLGGHLLCLVRSPRKVAGLACAEEKALHLENPFHTCWIGHHSRPARLLPLPLTCRAVYAETIPIIYRDNMFDLDHPDIVVYLQRTVLDKRRCEIRVLTLTWDILRPALYSIDDPSHNYTNWDTMCSLLAAFSGLERLTIRIESLLRGDESYAPWIEPFESLARMKGVPQFDVCVPWPKEDCAKAAAQGNYPFRLLSEEECSSVLERKRLPWQ